MKTYTVQDIERFWRYVDVRGPDECWEWIGASAMGYGVFGFQYKLINAHRFSWWIHTGVHPEDLYVCHHCDNKLCCNPKHLFLGTAKMNMQDASSKGHMNRLKLADSAIHEIREKRAAGVSAQKLAEEYGVNAVTIRRYVK